jgi:hypothetical protein
MKKIILYVILISGLQLAGDKAFAQFKKGDKLLNIGLGLNSFYSGGIPFGASYEVGIDDNISVGAGLDYISYSYDYTVQNKSYSNGFSAVYLGARASYHVNELLNLNNDKIDLYGGASLGYRSFTWSDSYTGLSLSSSYGSGLYLAFFAGGKYYFSKSTAVFTELGAVGSTNFRLGVAFKF